MSLPAHVTSEYYSGMYDFTDLTYTARVQQQDSTETHIKIDAPDFQ